MSRGFFIEIRIFYLKFHPDFTRYLCTIGDVLDDCDSSIVCWLFHKYIIKCDKYSPNCIR